MTTRNNLRLASFDGGGIRGLSQAEIMTRIVDRLNWDKESTGSEPLLPWEYFDLMGGSGTGGLIAIMFAKLQMTVEEVFEEFEVIAEVYNQTDIEPSERTQRLKSCMEDLLKKRGLPINMKLMDKTQVGGCACFVVANLQTNASTSSYLRSYPAKSQASPTATVVEAVLATCVTPPRFAPISIGVGSKKKDYIGAGLGANNPTNDVIAEAHSLFGGDSQVVSLLSIGTGHPGIITLSSDGNEDNLYKAMQDIINDCTKKAEEIKQRIGHAGIYYRFSVEQGMQNDQAMDPAWIVTQTEIYMDAQEGQLDDFATNHNIQINAANLGDLKSGNVKHKLPDNLDMMKLGDTGPNNEVLILAKLKPPDLECGPGPAVGECMEGTREDIIATILGWVSDPKAPNIFWVKGHPGVGKSAISVTLTESLRGSGRHGSSFFFRRENANILTPNTLWRVVAYDLSRNYPTIRKQLLVALNTNEALPTTTNTEKLFRELIHEPLTKCDDISANKSPIVVIDALDECGGLDGQRSKDRESLCQTLKEWSTLPKAYKLIVTSRGEADLEELFSTTDHFPLEIQTGKAASEHSLNDIKLYFEQKFRQVASRYQSELPADWPGSPAIQELTSKSEGLFIWAEVIMDFFKRGEPQEQLSQILAGTGAGGMAKLYELTLKTAFPDPSVKVIDAFRSLVGTIIVARDPLPASSIIELCSIDASTMKHLRINLQSVMTFGDVTRFKHQSIVDFLLNPKYCPQTFLIDRNKCSKELALGCLRVMQKHLRFNICKIESSYYRNNDIHDLTSKIKKQIPPHITYSCCFWAIHLTESESYSDDEVYKSVCDFMDNRFLFWMEVLSLVKRFNRASSTIQLLIKWLQSAERDDKMAVDMNKFISMFESAISQSAPHIYLSALPFSPRRSLVSRRYRESYPGALSIRIGGQIDWPTIQNVLTGLTGHVTCVAFSPDGKRVISGSDDMAIRVMNTATGEVVAGPFEGHTNYVYSVAFSLDGKRVVSGSNDKTIRTWDVETGEAVAGPFEGHTGGVTSVAFSLDGKRVVSGSEDKTIRVWDAETGEILAGPFIGHTGRVTSVTFSLDSKRIISNSWDNTTREWNIKTGSADVKPFEGHTDYARSIVFSSDGRRVVSGPYDATIQAWDAERGEVVERPFEGHIFHVTSVAFSPNGKRVVSSSDDRTIRIWDAKTGGAVAGPFEGHSDFVKSVAFSPDGKRVVSGSYDMTILVRDVETGKVISGPFKGHTSHVTSVAFSPDGKRIASASDDRTIRVWDAETGEVVGPFKGHTDYVKSVAFSPDGKRIMSGSYDKEIRIWDVETNEAVAGPFQGHAGGITSVAFSPDGRRVVSGSEDRTIRVWDAETGEVVSGPFEGHTFHVTSVAFSPDGTCVVSGSDDWTIRVWNVESGKVVAGPFEGHNFHVASVAFSPDGNRIVSGSMDTVIRVWDVKDSTLGSPHFADSAKMVDGWVLGPNSELLFWVPPDLRTGLYWPRNTAVIGRFIKTKINFGFAYGENWSRCKDQLPNYSR